MRDPENDNGKIRADYWGNWTNVAMNALVRLQRRTGLNAGDLNERKGSLWIVVVYGCDPQGVIWLFCDKTGVKWAD